MADLASCGTEAAWHWCFGFNCLINWLDHWQTLISGLAAVGAAGVSIYYLRRQIDEASRIESARRKRRLAAARARLQLALSDIVHYASQCIALLKQYLDASTGPHPAIEALAALPRPVIPETAILVFEAVIEATDDDEFASVLAETVSRMQVMNSRIGGLVEEGGTLGALNLHSYLRNAAEVHAYASAMFEYARRETESPPHALDWAQVKTALNLNDIRADDYEDLHAFIDRAATRAALAMQASN